MKLALAVFACAALSHASCVAPKPKPRLAEFIPSEYEPYSKPGTGCIEGQAFAKTRGGDVKYAAGNFVWLNPVTTYSSEWFDRYVINYEVLEEPDFRANEYHRETIADGFGNFRFEGLPSGEYYVGSRIVWEYTASGYYGPMAMPTGAVVYARAHVEDGKTAKVVVTR